LVHTIGAHTNIVLNDIPHPSLSPTHYLLTRMSSSPSSKTVDARHHIKVSSDTATTAAGAAPPQQLNTTSLNTKQRMRRSSDGLSSSSSRSLIHDNYGVNNSSDVSFRQSVGATPSSIPIPTTFGHTIRFRREHPNSFVDRCSSSDDDSIYNTISRLDEVSVMDLRSSSVARHHAASLRDMDRVDLPSNISIDKCLTDSLFQVATVVAGSNGGDGLGLGNNHGGDGAGDYIPSSREDALTHWQAASSMESASSSSSAIPMSDHEQTYQSLMSLMRNDDGSASSVASSCRSGESFVFYSNGRTANVDIISVSSSERGGSSDVSSGSSKLWDRLESNSMSRSSLQDTQLSFDSNSRRKQRRKLYVRACVKTMVGILAMATLSLSVSIYFITDEKDRESMFNFFLHDNDWLGKLFGYAPEDQHEGNSNNGGMAD